MLKFLVFEDNQPAKNWPLRNAHLLGSDSMAMRGSIKFQNGMIVCEKREAGVAALSLQHKVGECGEMTLQTCLLPDRDEPYILSLEMARHRLMTFYSKCEDWGMFDIAADHPVARRMEKGRKAFIEALCHQNSDPMRAETLACEALEFGIDGTEELAMSHADLLLNKRRSVGSLPKQPLGCGIHLAQTHERLRGGLLAHFDFVALPMPWKLLEPEEGGLRWDAVDDWVDWAARNQLPIHAGPLLGFDSVNTPDWLYMFETEYDTVKELIREHVERVVQRYKDRVQVWNVASGLHLNSHITFAFDQVMELTRVTTMMVKKLQPSAKVLIELRQPFGEYFANNQRSIPPMMFVDLMIQQGIGFDGLIFRMLMGQALPGQYVRDLMQISNLLDQFAGFQKPIQLAIGVPSDPVTQEMIAPLPNGAVVDANAGQWRRPWSANVQAHFLEAVAQIAISKPIVESLTWHELIDHPTMELPLSGLIGEDMQPKPAFKRLPSVRRHLMYGGPGGGSHGLSGGGNPPPSTPA